LVVGSSPSFRAIFPSQHFPKVNYGMFAKVSRFVGEVKGELRKASWPWESDPKIKGIKKYKELVDSTVVVLIATILLAGFVSLWDFICTYVINFIASFGH
jgi:preprotein translocase subunit SecE